MGGAAPAAKRAGEAEEGFVDVGADLPTDAQPAEGVRQRGGLLDVIAVFAQARALPELDRTAQANPQPRDPDSSQVLGDSSRRCGEGVARSGP